MSTGIEYCYLVGPELLELDFLPVQETKNKKGERFDTFIANIDRFPNQFLEVIVLDPPEDMRLTISTTSGLLRITVSLHVPDKPFKARKIAARIRGFLGTKTIVMRISNGITVEEFYAQLIHFKQTLIDRVWSMGYDITP